ncbi:amidase signature enzyme [Xylaria bambusicola]|uniref:amidase signature enzyme n=1 Tax=Xylaria bambusicola TaxID=326684 RepID=UPI00200725BB|nr:amidase signature enzyme [Xylaria bambusicola]KAI0503107.1 amidase signature enzyme [Xylaria bambusicola]
MLVQGGISSNDWRSLSEYGVDWIAFFRDFRSTGNPSVSIQKGVQLNPRFARTTCSIAELAALLKAGDFNSQELVKLYVQRVGEVNDDLGAVIELNPDAVSIARHLDRERADGKVRGPLHGIPILVKDNYATVDSMLTGSGSVCLARALPTEEATVIAKLREAGAIILGKLNLSEFAGIRSSNATPGWSPRGGQTFGAYVKNQTACGSSSGSGVAASVGLAAGTLGTETSGSITCPAMYNNVVGVKPTVGLTSRFGVVPVTARQDTTGPITQNVEDAAILLEAMAGKDLNDNYTSAQPWGSPPHFSTGLRKSGLKGARIGVVWMEDLPVSGHLINIKQIKPVFDRAVADLKSAGAEVVDVALDTKGQTFEEILLTLQTNVRVYMGADFNDALPRYLENIRPSDDVVFRNVSDVLQCLKTEPRELASTIGLADWENVAQLNITAGSLEAWNAFTTVLTLSKSLLLDPIEEHGLDALVMLPDLALSVGAAPGFPIVTVPMGVLGPEAKTAWDYTNKTISTGPGIPLGLSFTADKWSDQKLIQYAYAYEQASQRRRELIPIIKPESDLCTLIHRSTLGGEM